MTWGFGTRIYDCTIIIDGEKRLVKNADEALSDAVRLYTGAKAFREQIPQSLKDYILKRTVD